MSKYGKVIRPYLHKGVKQDQDLKFLQGAKRCTVFVRLSAHDRISAQGLFFTVRGGMDSKSARVQ